MKIVINSNIHYKKPLKIFFDSLCRSGFDRFEDIILVMSQSPDQIGPIKEKIKNILPISLDIELCFIQMQMNNFDYCGYHALNIYKDDPLVFDNEYLYVLDTSTFDADFPDRYSRLKVEDSTIITCDPPHSNICMFDRKVVDNYGDNFSIKLNKAQAVNLELHSSRNIISFGKFVSFGKRIIMETFDIYDTSYPRVRANYPYFGINKWILWGKDGDITGELTKPKKKFFL